MADATIDPGADSGTEAKKPSRLPLVIGLIACLALGGGGFYAAYSGMLDGLLGGGGSTSGDAVGQDDHAGGDDGHTVTAGDAGHGPETDGAHSVPSIAFVEIEPLIVSLGSGRSMTHLRFRGHLEVASGSEGAVEALMPRVLDVLNGYLRALRPEELADPSTLIRLRAQMLRRVQLVVGGDLVKDLLVAEFVLN